MSKFQRIAGNPSSRPASDALAAEIAASLKTMQSARPVNSASEKPASVVAPSDAPGATAAETKLYEVPPELIEIARASRQRRVRAGTLTPLAPRPEAEQAASAQQYAAAITQSPRAPSALSAAGPAPESGDWAVSSGSQPAPGAAGAARARHRAGATRVRSPGERRSSAPSPDAAPERTWLYVSLLVALGYCAQLAWPW